MATPTAIKKIVVGLDGSPQSQAALEWAVEMAQGMHAHVTAVYAIDLPPPFYPESYVMTQQFDDEWRKTMRAEVENTWCKALRDAGVEYRAVMEDGRAASVISRVAEAEGADVIVVGRRGRGGIAEFLLGSTTHELVLRSKVPVLVVEPATSIRKPRNARHAA
ncbi:MAG TPA: universal stress protein [Candidatus Dormibacteraeota bacterium]|nr:universal stress protein [Candidatus Dormibacteraeota bacterium]